MKLHKKTCLIFVSVNTITKQTNIVNKQRSKLSIHVSTLCHCLPIYASAIARGNQCALQTGSAENFQLISLNKRDKTGCWCYYAPKSVSKQNADLKRRFMKLHIFVQNETQMKQKHHEWPFYSSLMNTYQAFVGRGGSIHTLWINGSCLSLVLRHYAARTLRSSWLNTQKTGK